jgi:hypothetical protein
VEEKEVIDVDEVLDDEDLEVNVDEELSDSSDDMDDESEEDNDPFAALYEDEETEDEGADGEASESEEAPPEKNDKYDRLSGKVKETLKKLGYDGEGEDPEEMLNRLEAEANGVSRADYERKKAFDKRAADDLAAIHAAYPETAKYKSWKEFPNHVKFAHLMDNKEAKLSAVEAFSAAHPDIVSAHVAGANRAKNLAGTKSHLTSSVPKGAKDTGSKMTRSELNYYRDLLPDATDEEIKKIYKRIT